MKLLLVHLSDIHIRGEQEAVFSRKTNIIDAVKNLEYSLDGCVIVVTGDIAYAGTEGQLVKGWEFLESLKTSLTKKLNADKTGTSIPVHLVAIPGNHDCDFQDVGSAREIVINGIKNDHEKALDESMLEICTGVQEKFFEVLDAFASEGLQRLSTKYMGRLYYEYSFNFRGKFVKFRCCNTAWVSQLHESPGSLVFPDSLVPENSSTDALTVALLHHNLNWLEPTNGRSLRKRLESSVDIILTGHEHDSTRRTTDGGKGEHSTHIEGGALYDPEYSTKSTFNALIIDSEEKKQKFGSFEWNGERYVSAEWIKEGQDGAGLAWEEFAINRIRQSRPFTINESMLEFLNDPDAALPHPAKGLLRLSDIYVFPDLRELIPQWGEIHQPGKVVPGRNVLSLIEGIPKLLITGDTRSGKSCLGKMLFSKLHDCGYVPILVRGTEKLPSNDSIFGYLEKVYKEQYEEKTLTEYQQLDRSKRAIILDDYHQLSLNSKTKRQVLDRLEKFAGKVILFGSELSLISEIATQGGTSDQQEFSLYRIMQFGHAKRNQLIEKWLFLDPDKEIKEEEIVHQISIVTGILDTIIGKNFVPAYPIYILSVLVGVETGAPIDTRASTHGYFYELLIRETLARGLNKVDFDIRSSYLANIAFKLFLEKRKLFDYSWLRQIHAQYEIRLDIQRPCDKLLADFIKQTIFEERGGNYKFKYRYLYYYFVASYLRDRITDSQVENIIRDLSKALYVEENANILLFLAHLSKDPIIITSVLEIAGQLFQGIECANFKKDISFLGEKKLTTDLAYIDQDPNTSRQKILEAMDGEEPSSELEEGGNPPLQEVEQVDFLDPLNKLNTALKTVQILGQILKNFPGSIEALDKFRIADATYALGLRCIGSFFELVKQEEQEILKDIIDFLREQHPGWLIEDLERRAKNALVDMAQMVSYCLIKRISVSVGSPDLFTTFNRLLTDNKTPGYQLIHSSILLDHSGSFPHDTILNIAEEFKNNWFATSLLQCLVVQHFDLFPVNFKIKQIVCGKLHISYKRAQTLNPERKLIN